MNGTAAAGTHYEHVNGTLTWADGDFSDMSNVVSATPSSGGSGH